MHSRTLQNAEQITNPTPKLAPPSSYASVVSYPLDLKSHLTMQVSEPALRSAISLSSRPVSPHSTLVGSTSDGVNPTRLCGPPQHTRQLLSTADRSRTSLRHSVRRTMSSVVEFSFRLPLHHRVSNGPNTSRAVMIQSTKFRSRGRR